MLGEITDLACRRAEVLSQIRAVRENRFSVAIGGNAIGGSGVAVIKAKLIELLDAQLRAIEDSLAELGVTIDRADDQATGLEARQTVSSRAVIG